MIRLFVTVEDITAVLAADYTVIRVYTDTSETGDFTTLDGTITLVAGTESYEYTDLDGTTSTWYKTAYYGATPDEGTKSDARKGGTAAAYATVNEFRDMINITSGATHDVEIARLLDAAAQTINRVCNRPDGFRADATSSARIYKGSGRAYQYIDECVEIDAVAVKVASTADDYTEWASTDYLPFSGSYEFPDFNGLPYTGLMVDPTGDESIFTGGKYITRPGFRPSTTIARGVPTVQVTARWGYADDPPAEIREANVMQAARWYKRLQSAMSDTVASVDFGQLMYRKVLDPDIELILAQGRYIRPAIGRAY